MKATPQIPAFGSREWKIYRYGILEAAQRQARSEHSPCELPESDLAEMASIRAELGMDDRQIVDENFRQFGVSSEIRRD